MSIKLRRAANFGCIFWFTALVMITFYQITSRCSKDESQPQNIKVVVDKTNYDLCINNMKKNESLQLNTYKCPAGYPTIGYGHMLKKGEQFSTITEQQADSLLEADFNTSIQEAYRITGFTGDRCLAFAHFFFAFGTNKYYKSTLRKIIEGSKDVQREDIEREWLGWCNYKDTSGVWHEVPALKKARQFEVDLFFAE